ncbi:MAG: ferritin-like domain-containing protein [Janthinobacterium lividum]
MGLITPNDYDSLRTLYTGQLQYLLSTEEQIVDGLESMIKHAQDEQLIQAFKLHQQQTRDQADRLKNILNELTGEADNKKDPVTTALIGSGTNIVRESSEGPVRDAGLLATAQKIEHYEIASYGAARDWAKLLGHDRHVTLLEKTLEEEKQTDKILTSISQHENRAAAMAS